MSRCCCCCCCRWRRYNSPCCCCCSCSGGGGNDSSTNWWQGGGRSGRKRKELSSSKWPPPRWRPPSSSSLCVPHHGFLRPINMLIGKYHINNHCCTNEAETSNIITVGSVQGSPPSAYSSLAITFLLSPGTSMPHQGIERLITKLMGNIADSIMKRW